MLKILVLGSTGMAGHVITKFLEQSKRFEVYNISHSRKLNENSLVMDVGDIPKFSQFLDSADFDVIINCVGVLNQFAEKNKDLAVLINGYIPHYLEKKYNDTGTRIIHISTDCVFSGKAGGYIESSFRDGDTFYDRTKAIGEIVNNKDLTFRMSIIGPDINNNGIGLFNWFMKSKGDIQGYRNAIWTGVTTIELAKAIEAAIDKRLTGLYHLVPKEAISKYDLLTLFKEIFERNDIQILKNEDMVINKSLINTRNDFDYEVPSYKEMIVGMKEWILKNRGEYHHYFYR